MSHEPARSRRRSRAVCRSWIAFGRGLPSTPSTDTTAKRRDFAIPFHRTSPRRSVTAPGRSSRRASATGAPSPPGLGRADAKPARGHPTAHRNDGIGWVSQRRTAKKTGVVARWHACMLGRLRHENVSRGTAARSELPQAGIARHTPRKLTYGLNGRMKSRRKVQAFEKGDTAGGGGSACRCRA